MFAERENIMKALSYHWNNGQKEGAPVRICVTNMPAPLAAHAQNELELMYFFKTSGCIYKCEGQEYLLSSGELVAVNPGEIHACREWGENVSAMCLIIDLGKIHLSALLGLQIPNKVESHAFLRDCFECLYAVLTEEDSAKKDCTVFACLYEILGFLMQKAQKKAPCRINTVRKKELLAVMGCMSEHLSENVPLRFWAEKMHLSEDRFYHVFKEFVGVSPTEYLLNERLRCACALLRDTPMRITDIAQECGFCTSGYFAKQFRAHMGCTPFAYRQNGALDSLYQPHTEAP